MSHDHLCRSYNRTITVKTALKLCNTKVTPCHCRTVNHSVAFTTADCYIQGSCGEHSCTRYSEQDSTTEDAVKSSDGSPCGDCCTGNDKKPLDKAASADENETIVATTGPLMSKGSSCEILLIHALASSNQYVVEYHTDAVQEHGSVGDARLTFEVEVGALTDDDVLASGVRVAQRNMMRDGLSSGNGATLKCSESEDGTLAPQSVVFPCYCEDDAQDHVVQETKNVTVPTEEYIGEKRDRKVHPERVECANHVIKRCSERSETNKIDHLQAPGLNSVSHIEMNHTVTRGKAFVPCEADCKTIQSVECVHCKQKKVVNEHCYCVTARGAQLYPHTDPSARSSNRRGTALSIDTSLTALMCESAMEDMFENCEQVHHDTVRSIENTTTCNCIYGGHKASSDESREPREQPNVDTATSREYTSRKVSDGTYGSPEECVCEYGTYSTRAMYDSPDLCAALCQGACQQANDHTCIATQEEFADLSSETSKDDKLRQLERRLNTNNSKSKSSKVSVGALSGVSGVPAAMPATHPRNSDTKSILATEGTSSKYHDKTDCDQYSQRKTLARLGRWTPPVAPT